MATCEQCGKVLACGQQRFCSRKCSNAESWAIVVKPCAYCGKDVQREYSSFQKNKSGNIYCNPTCRGLYGRDKPLGSTKPSELHICPACGKAFEVGGRGNPARSQKCCSIECQRRARYRRGARCNDLSVAQAAYIAGIMDGEGSVILGKHREIAVLHVGVTNTDRVMLDWLAEKTGVGAVNSQYKETEIRKATWFWRCNAEAAESLLGQIQPYLITKSRQAILGMVTQQRLRDPALHAEHGWQMEHIQQMKLMNKRGPVAV